VKVTLPPHRNLTFALVDKFLERLITGQNDPSVIQRFHAFTPAAIGPWDTRNVCIDDSGYIRINTTPNGSYKFRRNVYFVESWCSAFHGDSCHDLGRKWGLGESLLADLVICSERGDGFCDELWFGI